MYFVYILLCDKDFFYVGLTDDLERRLRDHRFGYSPFTRRFKDIELVYSEKHNKRSQAESREKQVKGWSSVKKKALIAGDKEGLRRLSKSKS
jgi:predicted GIY-YIG superfamily endonuclease